jgi:anti-anti-sigma factor
MAHPHTALRLGDHVCWTFDRDDDRLTGMAEVVEAGARRYEKVLYLTESLLPTALLAGLEARGGAAGGASGRGQLVIDHARDTYLVANRLFTRRRAMAVCQYDQRLFSAARLRQASAAHPGSTAVDSGVVWAPLLRMERTPAGLRVAGEADMSNRGALTAVLDAMVEEHRDGERPAVVDLSGLTFADAAAVGLLLRVAAELPSGVRIVGCRPTVARMLALLGADEVPGLTVSKGGR